MANHDILAIGASAGGIEALKSLARALRGDLAAAVLVVVHLSNEYPSELDRILSQAGPLPASFADDDEALQRSHIYLAPPGRHLLLDGDRLHLGTGPRENHARPAIDPLLRSAAVCCGPRSIGVILTGTLGDGAAGLHAIKQCGGIAVAQDPADAAYPSMPRAAIARAPPDHVVALATLPSLLDRLVAQPPGNAQTCPDFYRFEVEIARNGRFNMTDMDRIGRRSALTCPDCHGALWEIEDGELVRYRCHVGHAYTADAMNVGVDEDLNRALGSALRALEERVMLAQRLHDHAAERGHNYEKQHWAEKLAEYEQELAVIRNAVGRFDETAAHAGRDGK